MDEVRNWQEVAHLLPQAVTLDGKPFVRAKWGEEYQLRIFRGTKGRTCLACGEAFSEDDITTVALLGPGGSEEARQKCVDGRWYNAVGVELHWVCATGAMPTDVQIVLEEP